MLETNKKPPTVLVLVDRTIRSGGLAGKRARDSLWNRLLPGSAVEMSITDSLGSNESVRINEFDVVVVNWDAANGDPVTGSDDTLSYFMNRAEDRREILVMRGGKLLCEFQSASARLHQGAYDAIFGKGETEVMKAPYGPGELGEHWCGPGVKIFPRYRRHPILRGLPGKFKTGFQEEAESVFNFPQPQGGGYIYRHRERLLWLGWFRWWKKGWVPLLIADLPPDHPGRREYTSPPPVVLLAKQEGNGLLLASTLWIAFARVQKLVDNILSVDISEVTEFHDRVRRRRVLGDSVIALILLLILAVLVGELLPKLAGLVPSLLLIHKIGYYFVHLAEDFGRIWFLILFGLFYSAWVWNRPYGASMWTWPSISRAARSVKSFFGLS